MRTRALLSYAENVPAGRRWQSSIQRVGRPLAIFAIILQFALLFSHHHFDVFSQRWLPHAPALFQTGQATPTPYERRQDPAPFVPADGPCLVCMAIHAAASLNAGVSPLVLPVFYDRAPVMRPAVGSIMPPPRAAAFDSRGPPRA
jgi:hypothetical protein